MLVKTASQLRKSLQRSTNARKTAFEAKKVYEGLQLFL